MRVVASFASLLLLALGTLVLQGNGLLGRLSWFSQAVPQPLQQIQIFSAGEGQLGALRGIRVVGTRMLVDGTAFRKEQEQGAGLLLLEIDAEGRTGVLEHYALAAAQAELERLIERLGNAALDSVFLVAIAGRVEPLGDSQTGPLREHLVRFFESLGTQSQPATAGPCSLAYLFVRRPQGFVPLAESFSDVTGVQLCFQLQADRSVYDQQGALVIDDGRASILLQPAKAWGPGVKREPKRHLGPRMFSALSVPVALGEPALVNWRLGDDRSGAIRSPFQLSFEARIGLSPTARGRQSGVRFELLVDGAVQCERVLFDTSSTLQGWDLWGSPLRPELRAVDLVQVRLTRFGAPGTPPLRAYLGLPRLMAGSTGRDAFQ